MHIIISTVKFGKCHLLLCTLHSVVLPLSYIWSGESTDGSSAGTTREHGCFTPSQADTEQEETGACTCMCIYSVSWGSITKHSPLDMLYIPDLAYHCPDLIKLFNHKAYWVPPIIGMHAFTTLSQDIVLGQGSQVLQAVILRVHLLNHSLIFNSVY